MASKESGGKATVDEEAGAASSSKSRRLSHEDEVEETQCEERIGPQQPLHHEVKDSKLKADMIMIPAKKDVARQIASYFRDNRVFGEVVSATGMISHARLGKLKRALTSHEGRFEIISLRGVFDFRECGRMRMQVTLSNSRNLIFGGVVAGPLISATPIQVVILVKRRAKQGRERKRKRGSTAARFVKQCSGMDDG